MSTSTGRSAAAAAPGAAKPTLEGLEDKWTQRVG